METGEIAELEELEREVAPDLVGLGRYLGLGPKRAVQIARLLDVRTADELRQAILAGRLCAVPGVGPKTEAKLRATLEREPEERARQGLLLNRAWELAGRVARALGGGPAGDPRRFREACERLAVVCAAADAAALLERFRKLPEIVAVIEQEGRRALGATVDGVPIEIVVAAPERFGTELIRATGAAAYVDAEPLPDGPDEESVYRALGVPWCPPELRETPFRSEPPQLVVVADIRGDLHCHTTWSDGRASVLEMAEAALARGYEYAAICDHTPAVGAVPGLNADDLRRQAVEIAEANEQLEGIRVLRGTECDILPNGRTCGSRSRPRGAAGPKPGMCSTRSR